MDILLTTYLPFLVHLVVECPLMAELFPTYFLWIWLHQLVIHLRLERFPTNLDDCHLDMVVRLFYTPLLPSLTLLRVLFCWAATQLTIKVYLKVMYQRVWLTTDVICKKMYFGNYKINTKLVFHLWFHFGHYKHVLCWQDVKFFDEYELSNQAVFFSGPHDSHAKSCGKSAESKQIIRSDQV